MFALRAEAKAEAEIRTLLLIVLMLLPCVGVVHAQVGLVEAGRDIYRRECASCHGVGGTGQGPAMWLMDPRPPDITVFADGRTPFPVTPLRNMITGRLRLIPSHGSSEMTFFGRALDARLTPGGFTELDAVVAFVEYLQVRRYQTLRWSAGDLAVAGRSLFASNCATCHGADGRGGVPSGAYVVGARVPDLTTMTVRHSGQMEISRIVELIARCEEKDQSPEMPSWIRVFERQGWSKAEATSQIESLAGFLLSIQR